jgi:hypothetical protein
MVIEIPPGQPGRRDDESTRTLANRSLGLRRRPVDLGGQDEIAENWSRLKMELPNIVPSLAIRSMLGV